MPNRVLALSGQNRARSIDYLKNKMAARVYNSLTKFKKG
jgi:hypothetical protein